MSAYAGPASSTRLTPRTRPPARARDRCMYGSSCHDRGRRSPNRSILTAATQSGKEPRGLSRRLRPRAPRGILRPWEPAARPARTGVPRSPDREVTMRTLSRMGGAGLCLLLALPALPAEPPRAAERAAVADSFPPPESKGGWPTLLPEKGDPSSEQKQAIRDKTGVDWDKLAEAWEFNAAAGGATGLLVIRHGQVVGEWYKNCDRQTAFNIYSSSKAYTSTAF